jgi:hypothetical protein
MLEATGKKFGIAITVTNLDLIITIVITCLQSRNRSHVLHIFAICECSSRTPAYHISGSGGQDFVFAISGDEMTRSSISSPPYTILGFKNVNKGPDMGTYLRQAGDQGGCMASSTHNNPHDSLTNMVFSSKPLKQNYIKFDIFDKTDATVLAIGTTAPSNSRMANMVTARLCYDKIKFFPS